VSDEAIAFHLSESETAVSGTSFGRLTGEDGARTSGSGVHLVEDHVLRGRVQGSQYGREGRREERGRTLSFW
jgi:hypothetical protein